MRHPVHQPTSISRDARARAAIYLSVLASYAATLRDDPFSLPLLATFLVACLWSLGFEHRIPRAFLPTWAKISLVVAGTAVFLVFLAAGEGETPEGFSDLISRFLFWNAVVFVLSRHKTEHDLWTLAIVDISLFMVSGAFLQPPTFLPLLLAALACALYSFQRLTILRHGRSGSAPGALAVQLGLVLAVAALVFLLFPRDAFRVRPGPASASAGPDTPDPAAPQPGTTAGPSRVGLPRLSENLRLEAMAPLRNDSTEILTLRVTPLSENTRYTPGQDLYLRAGVFENYRNGTWVPNYEPRERTADADGWISVDSDLRRLREIGQEIAPPPAAGQPVIALGEPLRLKWPRAKVDASGVILLGEGDPAAPGYEVVSNFVPNDAEAEVHMLTPSPDSRWLGLPPGLDRLRRRAAELTSARPTPVGKIRALRDWLSREGGFTYSLGPFPAAPGTDPIEDFLFGRKRAGCCTHFAAALALMCRSVGVPARVAVGYRAQEYDAETGAYTVRRSNAHAWVEVPFPGHGWVRFDATPEDAAAFVPPPEGAPVRTGDAGPGKKPEQEEAGRWDRFVTDYGAGSQMASLRSIAVSVASGIGSAFRFLFSVPGMLALLAACAGCLLVYAILPRAGKRRIRRLLGGRGPLSSVPFYGDFLVLASHRNLHKHPAMTAREFAAIAGALLPPRAVDVITDKFCDVRYGGRLLSPPETDEVAGALLEIKSAAAEQVRP